MTDRGCVRAKVNEVARPLGLNKEVLRTVNYYTFKLHSADNLPMCSDGLHGVVEKERIEAIRRDAV